MRLTALLTLLVLPVFALAGEPQQTRTCLFGCRGDPEARALLQQIAMQQAQTNQLLQMILLDQRGERDRPPAVRETPSQPQSPIVLQIQGPSGELPKSAPRGDIAIVPPRGEIPITPPRGDIPIIPPRGEIPRNQPRGEIIVEPGREIPAPMDEARPPAVRETPSTPAPSNELPTTPPRTVYYQELSRKPEPAVTRVTRAPEPQWKPVKR